MENNIKSIKKLNSSILIMAIIMGLLGLFVILTASSYLTIKNNTGNFYYFNRQAIFYGLGILLMIVISHINYLYYKKFAWVLYGIGIVFLILCYVPGFSVLFNFARRGIKIGITFMPSDLMKIAAIITMSKWLITNREKFNEFWKGFVATGLIIAVPFFLILKQPDLSTSLVFGLVLGIMYLMFGFKKKFILYIILILFFGFLLFLFLVEGYQLNRIKAWLNPEKYYQNESWQVLNSLFAVSRGGVSGVGLGKSVYKFGYLSNEVNNDMIFAVIAEEMGFIGAMLVILLYFFFVYLLMKEAMRIEDPFGKYIVFGVGLLLFIQSFVNIGVSINIIPNTGITLPFISYGGTSLLVYYIMMGIVLNISRKNQEKLNKKLRIEEKIY